MPDIAAETSPPVDLPVPRRRWRRWNVSLITLLLLCIAAPIAWNNGLRDRLIAKNFGVVEEGRLFRSGQISARLIEPTLQSNGIKVIVALSDSGAKPQDVAAEMQAATDLGIDRQMYPLSGDGTGSVDNYVAAITAIDRAMKDGKPVLVHCVAGAQRTGGVIAAYLLLVEKRPPDEVYNQLRRYGHDPRENPHLLEYLNAHMGEIAQKLVDRGVIEKVPDTVPVIHEK
jgi:protein-tyrosine phosphatase